MSAVATEAGPIWPEHWASEQDLTAEQFLENVAAGEQTARPEDATEAPWLELHAWEPAGPVADAFFHDDSAVIALRGPVGSGKTTANLRSRFRRAMTMPVSVIDGIRHYKVVIARATYRQLWQTTIPSWWEIMPKHIGTWSGGRGDPVTHRIEWEDDHGPVVFIAEFLAFGESPAEVRANMRGVQTTDLLIEETDTCPVTVFTVGVTRIGRYPRKAHFAGYPKEAVPKGQISCSYNATDIDNWTVKTLERVGADASTLALLAEWEEKGVKIAFHRQPGYGEPGTENLKNLEDGYYDRQIVAMTAAGETDEIERLVYNRHSVVAEGDPVFKRDFNAALHVSPVSLKPWPGVPLILSFDQGLHGAGVVLQWKPPYRWQVLAEFCKPHRMLAQEFGEAFRAFLEDRFPGLPIAGAFGDMAGEADPGAVGENAVWNRIVGRATGVYIHPQTAGANRIQPRLAAIRAGLANTYPSAEGSRPCLYISGPDCPVLTRGFQGQYVFKEEIGPNGEKTKKPDKSKRAADVMDALGYGMMSKSPVEGLPPVNQNRPQSNRGHNGGPPLDDDAPGLDTGYDPLEYGT